MEENQEKLENKEAEEEYHEPELVKEKAPKGVLIILICAAGLVFAALLTLLIMKWCGVEF